MGLRVFFILLATTLIGCNLPSEKKEDPGKKPISRSAPGAGTQAEQMAASFTRIDSSSGQKIYIPVYSHIYQLNKRTTFNLTATLSFRNADINRTLRIKSVLYYDSDGNVIKNYLEEPITLQPLASTSFVVEEADLRGGVGANFIVSWESEEPVYPPIVEAVMISTSQQQGISFVSTGRVIENHDPNIKEKQN